MKIVCVTLIALCVALCCAVEVSEPDAPFSWKSCGSASDGFQVETMVMTPYPPVPGKNVTVTITGQQSVTINGGTWGVTIYYGRIPVQKESGQVCELNPDCPCPCAPGHYSLAQSFLVPSVSPSGEYTGKYTANNKDGKQLVCLDFSFTI